MLGQLLFLLWTLTPLTHGCPNPANVSNTLEQSRFFDSAVCGYSNLLTLPVFGAFFLVGVISLPMYIRTESVLPPFVVTVIVGGVMLTFVAGILQAIAVTVILFTIGLGPVLLLRRAKRG